MATDLNIQVKVNNQDAESISNPVIVIGGQTFLTWEFDELTIVAET